MAKAKGDMITQDKRYPAEGKGLDYSTALPLSQQTGADPGIPQPGRPTKDWDRDRAMQYRSTTFGGGH
jgi:hypothetical protein